MRSSAARTRPDRPDPQIPAYLRETYWWAYLHPRAVWFFEREWLVNLILWGNMRKLTSAVLEELPWKLQGPVLQIACVYGDFSRRLAQVTACAGSVLHLTDIAPIQLENARRKLADESNIEYHHQDSASLQFATDSCACSVLFFLLHEQPADVRLETVSEALRVTRPGGKLIIVDYHLPNRGNPLRYLMRPLLKALEPFALGMWENTVRQMLPAEIAADQVRSSEYCGGLYQKTVIRI